MAIFGSWNWKLALVYGRNPGVDVSVGHCQPQDLVSWTRAVDPYSFSEENGFTEMNRVSFLSRGAVLLIQRNLTPCAGQGINPLLTDGADAHTTPAPLPRPLSAVGVVAAVAPVTPEATHVRAVLVEVRLPRGLRPRPARDMRLALWF